MKKIFKFLPIFVILFLFYLVGCTTPSNDNPSKVGEGIAYGIINDSYVGMAKVKIKDGKVEDAYFDEAVLPHTWANIDVKYEENNVPEDVLLYSKNEINTHYAKYISIDGQVFTGEVRSEPLILDSKTYNDQVIKYVNEKIPDLFLYLYNSDSNCEWYFNAVKNQKVFVCDSQGNKIETYPSLNTYGWFKSEGKYWEKSDTNPLGWKGNIDNMISYLKGKTLKSLNNSVFVRDKEGIEENGYNYKYWTIDGVKTQVTMTGAYQYYKLAYSAYVRAEANAK